MATRKAELQVIQKIKEDKDKAKALLHPDLLGRAEEEEAKCTGPGKDGKGCARKCKGAVCFSCGRLPKGLTDIF